MRRRGPWSRAQTASFLREARIPLRLACNGASGTPVLASLWFFADEDERLWCATQRSARITRLLASDPRCAFEVADETPPYHGIRGQGVATLDETRGADTLERLIARYLEDGHGEFARWLRSRAADEVAIAIEPSRLLSWDFRKRMGGP